MSFKEPTVSPVHCATLKECLDTVCLKYPDKVAFHQVEGRGNDVEVTYGVYYQKVVALGAKLLTMGLKGCKCGLIGENSIHWIEAYIAVVAGVGVAVPIDQELDTETMAYQVSFADCEAVFLSARNVKKLDELQKLCPQVRYWILMRSNQLKEIPDGCLLIEDLIEEGSHLSPEDRAQFVGAEVKPEDLCDIIYTSGTTGANKAIMLSHKNVCTVICSSLVHIHVNKETLACLPIHHSYEKNCHVLCALALGNTLVINDDLMHLAGNLKKYRPDASNMVPMILETMERRIRTELKKRGMEAKVNKGVRLSNALRKVGIDKRSKIFQPILSMFGGDLHQIVVGGAPLKEENRRFFDDLGIAIVNGYGISECAPLVAANYTDYQRPGSVGHVIPGCEVKVVDPNEYGDGVIYVRGDNVMMGYYKDPESTHKVLSIDGWLDTGDIGHLDKDNFLYLSGRVKNLIILSNGKNVYPEEIEELLCQKIPYILESVVYTDDAGTGLYAMLYLDKEYIEANYIEDPYVYVMDDIKVFNRNMPSYKRIKDVGLSNTEFEKTTTKKIQRFKVKKTINKI